MNIIINEARDIHDAIQNFALVGNDVATTNGLLTLLEKINGCVIMLAKQIDELNRDGEVQR